MELSKPQNMYFNRYVYATWENDGSSGHILKHVQLMFSNMYKRLIQILLLTGVFRLLNSSIIIDESLIDFSRENALMTDVLGHRPPPSAAQQQMVVGWWRYGVNAGRCGQNSDAALVLSGLRRQDFLSSSHRDAS